MSTTVQSPAPSLRLTPRSWGMLLVLCGAIFLEGINVAMLNVALPAIRTDLGLSTGELQWVISAYVLGYGGFMAGGLLYTSFQFGAALGLAAGTAVIVATTAGGSAADLLGGYRAALAVPIAAAVLAAVISAFGLRKEQNQ
ncbi:hypothetical protein ACTMTI_41215 [Nonomuraea sp. H19]|uniref:hypothetical protein n=1 Tax=Nonomuraea sp. H19 TaxID=3452206 RepID=UPI003F8A22EC